MPQDITQDILSHAVEEVTAKFGRANLAELERMLPLTRQQLRRLQKNSFKLTPNGNFGKTKGTGIPQFSEFIDTEYLAKGIKNSSVILDAIRKQGCKGGITSVKRYIRKHLDLVPAPRILAASTPNRGRRYTTGPGEMFQMDWGFVDVCDSSGETWQCACFPVGRPNRTGGYGQHHAYQQ